MSDEIEKTVHHYGDSYVGGYLAERSTIHASGTIDVVVDPVTREVRAVWFRCLSLPFRVSERAETEIQPAMVVTAVEYVDGD